MFTKRDTEDTEVHVNAVTFRLTVSSANTVLFSLFERHLNSVFPHAAVGRAPDATLLDR